MRLTGEPSLQLARIRDGAFGYVDLSDGFRRLMVIDGEFETDFFRIADSLLNDGGCFFDVGANHGLFSMGLAPKAADRVRFHLFEPNSDLRNSIAKSLIMYPLMQAKIVSEAVSDRDGIVQFHFDAEHSGTSHVVHHGGSQVQSIRLDTYLESCDVACVDLMKMDIEGHELAALRGAENALRSRRIKAIYFEYCEKWLARNHAPSELLGFLDMLAYEVCFCRTFDLAKQKGPMLTPRAGLPGHGLPLSPIKGKPMPPATDLFAMPREDLAATA